MLNIFPTGYIKDLLHTEDLKRNPERHYLMKNQYSKAEAQSMCFQCAMTYDWNDKFYYNAYDDYYYKKKLTK